MSSLETCQLDSNVSFSIDFLWHTCKDLMRPEWEGEREKQQEEGTKGRGSYFLEVK